MTKTRSPQKGITLLELLVCLSIILIIISLGIPQFMRTLAYFESRSTQQSLLTYIASARAHALYLQEVVTLCPLAEDQSCSNDWNKPLTTFSDLNSNAVLDNTEEIISIWDGKNSLVNMSWTQSRRYIRFRPNGFTTATTGSLRYCSSNYFEDYDFRIVVARTGRTRVDRRDHGC